MRPSHPELEVPYVVAVITMDEGWHMMTNIIECEPEDVRNDMTVEVHFVAIDGLHLPFFRPSTNKVVASQSAS
jgi:uncharacterized OB-fold protein